MHHSVMDRLLVFSVLVAVAALGAGVAGVVAGIPALGVVAGSLGVVTGIAAAGLAVRLRDRDEALGQLTEDADRLRRDVDALTTMLSDRATLDEPEHSLDAELDVSITRHPASGAWAAVPRQPTGLVGEQHIGALLHQRVATARRHLQPLSVIVFALDSGGDDGAIAQQLETLGHVVVRTVRECDTVARVNDMMLAAILDGSAEHGALWAVERVRAALLESWDNEPVSVSAGIACYPTHALEAEELISAAGRALQAARQHGPASVQVAPQDR